MHSVTFTLYQGYGVLILARTIDIVINVNYRCVVNVAYVKYN